MGWILQEKRGSHDATGIFLGSDIDVTYKKNTTYNRIIKNFIGDNNPGIRIRGTNTAFNVMEENVIGLGLDHKPLTTNIDGTDHHLGTGFGFLVEMGATQNTIGGDTKEKTNIVSQLSIGIQVEAQTAGNKLGINAFFDNKSNGIFLNSESANNGIRVLRNFTTVETAEAQLAIGSSNAKPGALVDLYVADDGEICEGKKYIGTSVADAAGTWSSLLEEPFNDAGTRLVAIQQNATDGFSQFSDCYEIENFPPHFENPGERGTTEKQTLNFMLKAADANGDELDYTCVTCPEGLEVDSKSGLVNWTPPLGTNGQHSAAFSVTDGMLTDEISVPIVVAELDTTPQLADIGNSEVFVNTNIAFALTAPDEDGDEPQFTLVAGLEEDMEFNAATGSFSWTPGKNFVGSYTVVFHAMDNDKDFLFTEKELSIKVQRKFGPPNVEIEGEKIVTSGGTTKLTAKAIGPAEGISYTYSWKVHEGKGTLDQTNTQEVQYQAPEVEQNVEESLAVTVEDDEGNVTEKIISLAVLAKITVANPADPTADLPFDEFIDSLPDPLTGELGLAENDDESTDTNGNNTAVDENGAPGDNDPTPNADDEPTDQHYTGDKAAGCSRRVLDK